MIWTQRLPGRRSKFGSVRVEVDGEKFHSKAEARRWLELQQLQRAGQIRNLRRQVKYPLPVNDQLVSSYIADFVYDLASGDHWVPVVEDVKGVETDVFRLKAKLMAAVHGINVSIVRARA